MFSKLGNLFRHSRPQIAYQGGCGCGGCGGPCGGGCGCGGHCGGHCGGGCGCGGRGFGGCGCGFGRPPRPPRRGCGCFVLPAIVLTVLAIIAAFVIFGH